MKKEEKSVLISNESSFKIFNSVTIDFERVKVPWLSNERLNLKKSHRRMKYGRQGILGWYQIGRRTPAEFILHTRVELPRVSDATSGAVAMNTALTLFYLQHTLTHIPRKA